MKIELQDINEKEFINWCCIISDKHRGAIK